MRFALASAAAACVAFIAAPASATIYSYSIDNPGGASNAGDITNFSVSYNDAAGAEKLSLSVTMDLNIGNVDTNAAWLALSPKSNPKGTTGELALLYIDLVGNDVYAYEYSGQNNGQSHINPGNLIDVYTDVVTQSGGSFLTFGFDNIDVSTVQSYIPTTPQPWTGVSFGDHVGIWFHGVNGSITGDDNGISSFSYDGRNQSWYDATNRKTTVSEPMTVALLGLGLLGLGVAARRRK
ncbi:MAG: PEP-CTERM sorting domain-containing protein [Pseudomonadota bacterium]